MGDINKCKLFKNGIDWQGNYCRRTDVCNCGEEVLLTVKDVDKLVDQISEPYGNTPTDVAMAAEVFKSWLDNKPRKISDTEISNMRAWLQRTEN